MFFSDELIAVGRKSNPKNNASMYGALITMREMCLERARNAKMGEDRDFYLKHGAHCLKSAMRTLYKEGYSFFNPDTTKMLELMP